MKIIAQVLFILFMAHYSCYSQSKNVTGRLTDEENGKPMSGVSVTVKGTTTGTSTNAEGRFSITAPANGTLIFSFVGYGTKEVQINNRSIIDNTISAGNRSLDEVVVV